ncbi:flavodoxin family protein [Streptomyces antarcticus]|uniref:flavodoxin family protein n=1 Tax=Streptomyces antarcticus TaxID=2996458 RepID=UPI00226F2EA4|nr:MULTISPECIES: flavodoxin family protein [unclassified Streptomyces]MCY0942926.1 flavodoxin family protein [Streptomyces sp. H34-AA3]MCY0953027.1 flavodoxin family protein [Streptomyces sp. H27-S2]MCZ4083114.1 flavodoxin family protein [Streptomyces sp. H34-S5]
MTTAPKILAINGSERSGNTADVLSHAAARAAEHGVEFEVVDLRNVRMERCGPCGDCNDRAVACVVQDDIPSVVQKMIDADAIIFAAPVHGFGTASLMQTFIERAGVGYLRFNRPLSNKVAGVISVARRYSAGEVWAQLTVNALLNRMILVGSGFPATVHALHRGDALKDEEGLKNVDRLVDRMAAMIGLLREHRELTGRDALSSGDVNERVGLALNELVAAE